jgi:hypothetical protein
VYSGMSLHLNVECKLESVFVRGINLLCCSRRGRWNWLLGVWRAEREGLPWLWLVFLILKGIIPRS